MWRAGSVWRLLDQRAMRLASFAIQEEWLSVLQGSSTSATLICTGSRCLTGRGGMCEGSESVDEGEDNSVHLKGSVSRLTATSSLSTVIIIECRCCGRTGRLCVRLDLEG